MNFKEEIYEIAFGDNAINRDFDDLEAVSYTHLTLPTTLQV